MYANKPKMAKRWEQEAPKDKRWDKETPKDERREQEIFKDKKLPLRVRNSRRSKT
jgi:hypothetical protein